jgi:hypothetical protein
MKLTDPLTLLAQRSPRSVVALRGLKRGRFHPERGWFVPVEGGLLYVIGLGGGEEERLALDWLNQGRRLVLLEPDAQRLASWLHTPKAVALLNHERCEVHLLDEVICTELACKYRTVTEVVAIPRYQSLLPAFRRLIVGTADSARRIQDEFLRGGDLCYHNIYQNIRRLRHAVVGTTFFGQFQGVGAIICGAGPSLFEQLPNAYEGVILIAAGSAINALTSAGILPHLAVALDPHSYQFSRTLMHTGFEVPLFFRLRWCPAALAAAHGPLLYLPGAGGYPVVEWLEESLGVNGPRLEEGPTATCVAVELAKALGCHPITLAGVDLSLREGRLYAPGVTHAPEELAGYTVAKWDAEGQWLADRGITANTKRGYPPLPLREKIQALLASSAAIRGDIELALADLRASLVRCRELLERLCAGRSPRALWEVELQQEVAYELILEPILSCTGEVSDEFSLRIVTQNLALLDASRV